MKFGIHKTVLTLIVVALSFLAIGCTVVGPGIAVVAPTDPRPTAVTLRQERIVALREARDIAERQFAGGTATFEQVERVNDQLIEAELASATTPQQRADILSNAVKEAQKQEVVTQKRVDAGSATTLDALEAKAQRLALEIKQSEERADEGRH